MRKRYLTALLGLIIVCALLGLAVMLFWPRPAKAAEEQNARLVTFTWTAPADDWNDPLSGPCAEYEMRWRHEPVNGADTLAWWAGANPMQVTLPHPGIPGTTDSVSVMLDAFGGPYYVVLKPLDEMRNYSWSNVAVFFVDDVTPPSAIRDLRVKVYPNPTTDGKFFRDDKPSQGGQ